MAAFIYSDIFTNYDFGPAHPLRPERLKMTYELLQAYGALDSTGSRLVPAEPADEQDILLVHDKDYIEAVRKLSCGEQVQDYYRYGFGPGDNPPFAGMYEASLLYTGASQQAARMVASGEERAAFNISGGLHHAMRDRASGFCVFNDPVLAIERLLETYEKVAYVDIDAHHGDGVQEAFYTTSRVLTISIHESGRWIFPGSGFVRELGEGEGTGYNINLPVAPGSGDAVLLRVFREGSMPFIRAFDAPVVVAQLGIDGHFRDPPTHLNYTIDGWLEVVREVLNFGRPVVALGGGGYDPTVVCRAWTLAYGAIAGKEFPDEIPDGFARKYGIQTLRDHHGPRISSSEEAKSSEFATRALEDLKRLVFPAWT
ncbi:MAG: acetoin utilization protein AcuC [Armatimonadetes bacterium]|nr:acetoin utilization protein AcuC [Armatimonadota bacterium]